MSLLRHAVHKRCTVGGLWTEFTGQQCCRCHVSRPSCLLNLGYIRHTSTFLTISNESHFRWKHSKIRFDVVLKARLSLSNSGTCPSPSREGSDAKSNNIIIIIIMSLLSASLSREQRSQSFSAAIATAKTALAPTHPLPLSTGITITQAT